MHNSTPLLNKGPASQRNSTESVHYMHHLLRFLQICLTIPKRTEFGAAQRSFSNVEDDV